MIPAREVMTRYKAFAVVGLSENKEKYVYKVMETLLSSGYRVYPVNPKSSSIEGPLIEEDCGTH